MQRHATIVGKVVYRVGDGPELVIPIGPCEIDATSRDATISWGTGASAGVAALPIDVYTTYLTDGVITFEDTA